MIKKTVGFRIVTAMLSMLLLVALPDYANAVDIQDAQANTVNSEQTLTGISGTGLKEGTIEFIKENRYSTYYDRIQDRPFSTESLRIPAGSVAWKGSNTEPQKINEYKEEKQVLLYTKEEQTAEFVVTVPKSGNYYLVVEYYPIKSKDVSIEIGVTVDGKIPFYEASSLSLPRLWENETSEIQQDESGNQYAPRQVEHFQWMDEYLTNPNRDYDEPLVFYFEAGQHRLSLSSVREPFALKGFRLEGKTTVPSYEEYIKEKGPVTSGNQCIQIEAESAVLKSSQVLRPVSDRTSPLTTPYDTSKIRMNAIGGEHWKTTGQWLEWKIYVDEAGFYQPCFRYEQSYLEGIQVKRKMTIDGETLYQDMENVPFAYAYNWNLYSFGGDNPRYVYLSAGYHTLRLEVVLDDFCEIIRTVNDVVYDLNTTLRRIRMVVGSESDSQRDKYRDYQLDQQIPGLIPSLTDTVSTLKKIDQRLTAISRSVASQAAIVRTLQNQLESMITNPQTIPYRLDTLSSNIGSLSAWASNIKEQPLLLDKLYLIQQGAKKPAYKADFFQQTAHEIKAFFYSFVEDYNIMSDKKGDNVISLWIGVGREQAQILNAMIKDLYTPKSGISINVKLVNASVTEALLSGQAPDVMVMMGRTQPVDLAVRGVLMDLKRFSDFNSVAQNFMPTSLTPYEFNHGCYGLPDSETFMMQFYRKDIFEELGIGYPKTWDEFFNVISVIQKHNMDVGAGVIGNAASLQSGTIYSAMLYQNGGSFFNEKRINTELQTEAALDSFARWTSLYSQYSLPETYDFYNRFRKGEMPLAIASYTEFARLYEAAPEIRDLWDMVPIPGTPDSQGDINIAQAGSGTAASILTNTKSPTMAWDFLKWWTGKEAQERYSKDVEAQMGILARYPTANSEAFTTLGWTRLQYNNLIAQWQQVVDTPEIPGSYYLWRGLDNALKEVVYDGVNQREALILWDDQINGELERKRKEFGLYYDQ